MGAPENLLQQILKARQPTLLERYRADPIALRQQIESDARRARAADVGAFFARLWA